MRISKSTFSIRNSKGFTLAEVLIALIVIGVIAVLTIPTFMKNYQRSVFEAQFKHAYKFLSQGIERSYADNGDNFVPSDITETEKILDYLADNYLG